MSRTAAKSVAGKKRETGRGIHKSSASGFIDLLAASNNALDIDSFAASASCRHSFGAVVNSVYNGIFQFFTDSSCTCFATAATQHPPLLPEVAAFPAHAIGNTPRR